MELQPLNWTPRNHQEMKAFMNGTPPGLAVFDWDNTCIFGDIGEAFLRHQAWNQNFRLTEADWRKILPDSVANTDRISVHGREYSLAALKNRIILSLEDEKNSHRDEFSIPLLLFNQGLEETPAIGRRYAYRWVTRLLKRFTAMEIERMVADILQNELNYPIADQKKMTARKDLVFRWRSGLRIHPEIIDLMNNFKRAGWRIGVVTASHPWIVEAMTRICGYPVDQVVGMASRVHNGTLTRFADRTHAINYGGGKVTNIRRFLQQEPLFVAGDSSSDRAMLTRFIATRMRLVIDRGHEKKMPVLYRKARAEVPGFLLQPVNPDTGRFTPSHTRSGKEP